MTFRSEGREVEILTQQSLSDAGCDNPDCATPDCRNPPRLFFHGGWHDDGLDAMYEKATGYLTLICRECQSPVAVFLLAVGGH